MHIQLCPTIPPYYFSPSPPFLSTSLFPPKSLQKNQEIECPDPISPTCPRTHASIRAASQTANQPASLQERNPETNRPTNQAAQEQAGVEESALQPSTSTL